MHRQIRDAGYPAPNWVVPLLSRLARSDIYQRWNRSADFHISGNQKLANIHFAVLCCPDDRSRTRGGDISYQVNRGECVRQLEGVRSQ